MEYVVFCCAQVATKSVNAGKVLSYCCTICESQCYPLEQIRDIDMFNANWKLSIVRPYTARLQYHHLSAVPPFPFVSWAHLTKCLWHIVHSFSCPKQPLYQNYPPEENQFVYLGRVLHIRHFKPCLACSFTEKTSTGLKHVEEVDHCQQAKVQFKKGWPEQTAQLTGSTSETTIIHTCSTLGCHNLFNVVVFLSLLILSCLFC